MDHAMVCRWISLMGAWIYILCEMNGATFAEKCDPKYAKLDKDHTMCMKSRSCSGKEDNILKSSTLNSMEQMAIVDVHNKLRSLVATGRLDGQPPAQNMRQLIWDNELAILAQRWAEQCIFFHDRHPQRKTERFSYVGQNVAFEWFFHTSEDQSASVINTTVKMFNEVHEYGFPCSQIKPFVPKSRTGHYTQIAWADTIAIGCGFVIYKHLLNARLGEAKLIVCNFGPGGNRDNWEMYAAGAPACKEFSKQYPGLCATDESNSRFDRSPCELEEFKAHYGILCGDEAAFLKTYRIRGGATRSQCGPTNHAVVAFTKSAWHILFIVVQVSLALIISNLE